MLTDDLFYGTKVYHKKFSELCEPIKKYFGIVDAGYININKDGTVVNVHTNLKWMERYMEEQYYKLDPHMVHPDNMQGGLCMIMMNDDDVAYQEYNDVMLYEAVNKFNLYYGFTYVIKNKSSFTNLCFTTTKGNQQIINRVLNESGIIKYFTKQLSANVVESFPDLQKNRIDLVKIKGDWFYKQRGIICHK